MLDDAISVTKMGSVISFNATSASVAVPTDSAGSTPKYLRLAATQACYARLGGSGVTAAAGDLLVQPADSVVIKTHGLGYIAALQVANGGVLQISPLEDR